MIFAVVTGVHTCALPIYAFRQVVFRRAYAQKQPINEYKAEAFVLFERMLQSIREDVTSTVARIDFQFQEPEPMPLPDLPDFLTTHLDPFTGETTSADIDGGALDVKVVREPCTDRVCQYGSTVVVT